MSKPLAVQYEVTLYGDTATDRSEIVPAHDAYLDAGNLILTDPGGNWVAVYVTGSWTKLRRV